MKIVMFSSYYPPVQVGGAEVYAHELAKGLVKRGHEVTVLTYSKKPFTEHRVEAPYELDGVLVKLLPNAPTVNPGTLKIIFENLKGCSVFHLHLIHNYQIASLLILSAKLFRVPLVLTDHGLEFLCWKQLRYNEETCVDYNCKNCYSELPLTSKISFLNKFRLSRFLMRNYVDLVIAPSNFIKAVQLEFGIDEEKIRVIHNIVNLDDFRFTSLSKSKENTIMFAGALRKVKGGEYLIRAFKIIKAEIPNSKLIIAGDGPEKNDLLKLVEGLNIEDVTFFGWAPYKDMVGLYKETTMLVVPSIYPESFAIVGIEAMATGRPVIGSNVGGIPDWIEHGKTGFLVEPKNPEEIAERVIEILSDKNLAKEMSTNAAAKAKFFSVENHVIRVVHLYKNLKQVPP